MVDVHQLVTQLLLAEKRMAESERGWLGSCRMTNVQGFTDPDALRSWVTAWRGLEQLGAIRTVDGGKVSWPV